MILLSSITAAVCLLLTLASACAGYAASFGRPVTLKAPRPKRHAVVVDAVPSVPKSLHALAYEAVRKHNAG